MDHGGRALRGEGGGEHRRGCLPVRRKPPNSRSFFHQPGAARKAVGGDGPGVLQANRHRVFCAGYLKQAEYLITFTRHCIVSSRKGRECVFGSQHDFAVRQKICDLSHVSGGCEARWVTCVTCRPFKQPRCGPALVGADPCQSRTLDQPQPFRSWAWLGGPSAAVLAGVAGVHARSQGRVGSSSFDPPFCGLVAANR